MNENRREKIDLSGEWEIAFDPDNQGMQDGWVNRWPSQRTLPVQVPGIWNLTYPDADGVGFYRSTFTVPESWQGKAVLLNFEGVMYRCDVWINGEFAGSHEGGYTPFSLDITRMVLPEQESRVTVRVAALSKKMDVDGIPLQHAPVSKQSWYYVYGGIWGNVYLEACPKIAIETVSIDPCLRQERVQVEIGIQNRGMEYRQTDLCIEVQDPNGLAVLEKTESISALPGITNLIYNLRLPSPIAWTCEEPNIYRIKVRVEGAEGEPDWRETTFGMRDFSVHNGTFFLNADPIYIRGVLLQPNFPVTLIRHPDAEMMEREIQLVKEAGFNLIRVHLQPAPPGYLDIADRLGMLIYSETSMGWIRENPRMLDHGKREIEALIKRDRNHPSVVFWGVYNENPPASAINGAALSRYARSLDPTRVVVDNSGGSLAIDQDFGWIDRASVIPAFESQPEKILDVHLYLGAPISGDLSGWISDLGKGDSAAVLLKEKLGSQAVMEEFDRECRAYQGKIFVSELGYGGMSDLDETVAAFHGKEDLLDARELKTLRDSLREGFQKRSLEKVFGTRRSLYQQAQKLHALGNTQQIEALLVNPRISGFIITQLNDMAWEFHAGLLDLWRNPKPAYYAAQRLNQPQVIILRPLQRAVISGNPVEIDMTVVNRTAGPGECQLWVKGANPSNQEIFCFQKNLSLHPGNHPQERLRIPIDMAGEYRITAWIQSGTERLAEVEDTVLALDPVQWNGLPFNLEVVGSVESDFLAHRVHRENLLSAAQPDSPLVTVAAQPSSLSDAQWESLLQSVEAGGTAIIGALQPENSTAIQALACRGIDICLHFGIGSWMGCYHWAPASEIFAGLPAGGVIMGPFAETIPKYVLTELGGETLAGSLRNTQSRLETPAMLWYSDMERVQLGNGSLIFCQYRIFETLDHDPIAVRLAYNLLKYAARIAK